jgi:hypothetical protein
MLYVICSLQGVNPWGEEIQVLLQLKLILHAWGVAIFVSKYFTKVFSRTSNGKTTIFVVQHHWDM